MNGKKLDDMAAGGDDEVELFNEVAKGAGGRSTDNLLGRVDPRRLGVGVVCLDCGRSRDN